MGKDRVLNGDVLVSRLMRDGVQIGSANWFVKDQVLMWDIPGVTSGSITAAELTSVWRVAVRPGRRVAEPADDCVLSLQDGAR